MLITSTTTAKLGDGGEKESKAPEFQDSFPKIESTETLTTFVGNRSV